MTSVDERIGSALSADDREFLASFDEERGLFTQVGDVLTGPLGGWARLIFAVAFALGMFLLYAGWRFFTSDGGDDLVRWGLILLAVLTMQGFIKEWFYSRMNMLAVVREVKRLQLQIVLLNDREG